MKTKTLLLALLLAATIPAGAAPEGYTPADDGQRRVGGTQVLPEKFLRGYDPVTVYFSSNTGPSKGPADDGARFMRISPAWPGAYEWLDSKTLQFRPAEPWPALRRFSFKPRGQRAGVRTTMMSAPSNMQPRAGSRGLRPFRTVTLTFPQALPLKALEQMLRLEVRELPGLSGAARTVLEGASIRPLPRASSRDPARYTITLRDPVPEGRQLVITLALALGDEGKTLWEGRLATRPDFHVTSVGCGPSSFPLTGNPDVPREMALDCGHEGQTPTIVFSANVNDLTLTTLKKLVRFEPAVQDLDFTVYGSRVQLKGRFVPDVLYRMQLNPAPVEDDAGRRLALEDDVEVYFYLGWKRPFLRWRQGQAIVENAGPRMVPLTGYGEPRADLRIYRIDAEHRGLWPFPASPVVVREDNAPPFPGEEPQMVSETSRVSPRELSKHLRMLGSPLVSKIVDLPLTQRSGSTTFGLDLGSVLDNALGKRKPGHYLVGLRRLTGLPQRAYMRVQVTDLSLTVVEERAQAVFYVRSIDTAAPVRNALITLEAFKPGPKDKKGRRPTILDKLSLRTDADGRVTVPARPEWTSMRRIQVQKGEDVLVLNPDNPPPTFARNHWSPGGRWLQWLTERPPEPASDETRVFMFTERPLYKPGEPVFVSGYVRDSVSGQLSPPSSTSPFFARIEGPGGQRWPIKLKWSPLKGFTGTWKEDAPPTGGFQVVFFKKVKRSETVLARRAFAIEAFRTPKFEVQLSGPLTARLDEPFSVRALARYYAGGQVAGQPIRWTVTQRRYHYVPEGRDGFLFASSSQFARSTSRRGFDNIDRSTSLDDKGSDKVEVNPALDIDGSPRLYKIEATVTGADNQQVSATTEVRGLPPFVMGLKMDRYLEKATSITPEIITVGPDGKLSGGEKVTVRLYRRIWHSHLRETDFATGKASYVTEQEDKKVFETEITTGQKAVAAKLPIKRSGVYIVELVARDKLGRVQTLNADLYVGGKEAVAWKKSQHGVFELATGKKTYAPGETAELIIKSPFTTGKALVIVEKPRGNQYTWVDVRGGQATRSIRIDGRDVPNLAVHVVLMRGRIKGKGKVGEEKYATDDRYRPQTVAASHTIAVTAAENIVNVDLKHPKLAQPGTMVNFDISLTDDKKRPVAGEVTLWMVDEAVLALRREENLAALQVFIKQRGMSTTVRDTRNTVVGRLSEREETPGGDGWAEDEAMAMGASAKSMSRRMKKLAKQTRIRKNFKTVPFYKATLKVPSSGKLRVPVKMSDDLTNFKIRAVAASGPRRFGLQKSKIRVRLPVIVQPQLPRFVRQGDRFEAGGIARLVEGKPGKGVVKMSVKGPATGRTKPKEVDLKLGLAQSLTWPLKVAASAGKSQLTFNMQVNRKSDGVGDAFEVKLPVYPDVRPQKYSYFETFKSGNLKLKNFPEPPRAGTAEQRVYATSVKGLMEVVAGLEYLVDYPHGCLEQKMSQFAPQIAVAELVSRFGGTALYPRVRELLVVFLEDMAAHQNEQGLFGYWPGSSGDVQLTAQALEFLTLVERVGVKPTDASMRDKATKALKRALRSDYAGLIPDYRYNQQTAALLALTQTGHSDEHYLVELYNRRANFDVTSLADLGSAMGRSTKPFGPNREVLTEALWDTVAFRLYRGKRVFDGLQDRRRWGGYYLGSSTSSIAAVFEALSILDPKNKDLGLLRDALLNKADPVRGFGSTYNNRRAIQALLTYFANAKDSSKIVKVDFGKAGTLNLKGAKRFDNLRAVQDRPLSGTVVGEAYGRVFYSYLPKNPGDRLAGKRQGFIVQRSHTRYPTSGTKTTKADKRGAEREIKIGDILELHSEVTIDKRMHHVAIVVPFAAGLEPMNPELATSSSDAKPSQRDTTRATYTQRLDHEVRYYFDVLERGTHRFHFRVRAATQGSFTHPGAWAEQMYNEEVSGRGPGMRLIIDKK